MISKNIYFILLLFIIGCSPNDSVDQVKWDFYKKNLDVHFVIENSKIPFYTSNIILKEVDIVEGARCFEGRFEYEGVTSYEEDNVSKGIPIVHTICYDSNLSSIKGFYLGHSAYIDELDNSTEENENRKLVEVIQKKATTEFLKRFIKD